MRLIFAIVGIIVVLVAMDTALGVLLGIIAVVIMARVVPALKSPPGSFASRLERSEPSVTGTSISTSRWTIDLLRALEWHRFELLCRAYFEARGFTATTTRFGADGGVDINLYRGDSTAPAALVQCKAWNKYKVGIKPVRELIGVMAIENVSKGALITTGEFTNEAQDLAQELKSVRLIDGQDLLQRISDLGSEMSAELLRRTTDGDFTTPTCPSCGIKMTQRESRKDRSTFWGCLNYPRCKQTFAVRRPQ